MGKSIKYYITYKYLDKFQIYDNNDIVVYESNNSYLIESYTIGTSLNELINVCLFYNNYKNIEIIKSFKQTLRNNKIKEILK